MSRRACRTEKNLNEDDNEDDPEITSGDEAEREYERHANEPTDSDDVVDEKVATLVELMKTCHTKMIYTGAGISTAAKIPDYRGPGGVYTMAKKGIAVTCHDIVSQSPTTSHLVIKELIRHRYVSHIVSQNCDGMHLRSGIPQVALSEIHGNMHIEVCSSCPDRQYIRKFDVTENSGFRAHTTVRTCLCKANLLDTIVHYGERGKSRYPLNWEAAQELVPVADLIIVIGTSLQVLKEYKFLWPAPGSNAKIVIINLQWTPKDVDASLVIRADCEKVLTKLATGLEIDIKHYCRDCDPILTARRNTRNGELLMKMTDCLCHIRPPRCTVAYQTEEKKSYCPGWWRVGMSAIYKDISRERRSNTKEDSGYDEHNRDPSSNTPPPDQSVVVPKRGRPRKRKTSEGAETMCKGRRKASGSDDEEYEPERRHQRKAPSSSLRATRSSGIAEEQPLVGEFRKKRQDAGRRRGNMPMEEEEAPLEALAAAVPRQPTGVIEEPIEDEVRDDVIVEQGNNDIEVYQGNEDEDSTEEEEEEQEEEENENEEDDEIMYDEPLLNDVTHSSVTDGDGYHRPWTRRPQTSHDDENDIVDVVGDSDEQFVYENPAVHIPTLPCQPTENPDALHNDSTNGSNIFKEQSETFRSNGSSSLALSLSQLNEMPNEHRNLGAHNGDSLDLHIYDYPESHPDDIFGQRRYDAHSPSVQSTNRQALAANRPLHTVRLLHEPTAFPTHFSAQSTRQSNFVKTNQEAATTTTLHMRTKLYQRGPRRKKEPDQNSVEFFLRQINSGRQPVQTSTSIGAIYEAARQIVNPDDNEQQFQSTLISAVRNQIGAQQKTPMQAVPRPSKKAKNITNGEIAAKFSLTNSLTSTLYP